MFTGLVETLGILTKITTVGDDLRLVVQADKGIQWDSVAIGDSIAVNGVCLTVVALVGNSFSADASKETMSCTSLQYLQVGTSVNLELALTLSKPLGGHLVSGHVDGLARMLRSEQDARSIRYFFEVPKSLMQYIASKGSVCLDGISLTVNSVEGQVFDVNLIPHTQTATNAHLWKPGQEVNLEVDLIARYLERFMTVNTANTAAQKKPLTMSTLIDNGFVQPIRVQDF